MLRGLGSWFGLQHPEAGDQQPEGDTSPEQRSEAESAEGKLQQAGDQELVHQARGLGSESPRDQRLSGSAHNLPFDTPGARAQLSGVEGVEEGLSCLRLSQDGRGWGSTGQCQRFI